MKMMVGEIDVRRFEFWERWAVRSFLLNGRVFQMLIQEGVFRRTDRSEPLEIHASCFIQPHRRLVSTKFRNRGGKMNNRIIDTRHSAYDF